MSEWIKCSERLPDDSQDGYAVIVATHNSAGRFLSEVDVWCKGRKTFDYWGKKVTHWQPLPPPPAE
jgi:hypothetical protein